MNYEELQGITMNYGELEGIQVRVKEECLE